MPEKFDQYCSEAASIFMGMPELPSVEKDDEGHTITGFSTIFGAAEQTVRTLSTDEKLATLNNLVENYEDLTIDPGILDPEGLVNAKELLDLILINFVAESLYSMPEVSQRLESNMATHDRALLRDQD